MNGPEDTNKALNNALEELHGTVDHLFEAGINTAGATVLGIMALGLTIKGDYELAAIAVTSSSLLGFNASRELKIARRASDAGHQGSHPES